MARKLRDSLSVEAVFNSITIKSAEAVRSEEDAGRIVEGYKADLVVFDSLSPAMVCAAQNDAIAATILHSSLTHIGLVMVGGIVCKRDGDVALLPVIVDAETKEH